MWIAFTGTVGRILQSPAHHQIHHSDDPRHFDKNLGYSLAVSDWAFGTLAIPSRTREAITFGLSEESSRFRSTIGSCLWPAARSGALVARLFSRSGAQVAAPVAPPQR